MFGCPNKIKQEGDGTPYVCPRCNNAQVVEAKSRMWFELCWIPLVCTYKLSEEKRSNLFWLWRFHSNLAISGYVAFVSGKCLGMAISLCQLEVCLQKCDDPCVLYMTHGSVLSESFVVVVLLHCRLVHMKFTGHVVKPWTVYFCADGLTELWGTLHKMLKLMGTCHVLMRVRCTYPYIDCGHQLFWVAHNHSKQIDWQH